MCMYARARVYVCVWGCYGDWYPWKKEEFLFQIKILVGSSYDCYGQNFGVSGSYISSKIRTREFLVGSSEDQYWHDLEVLLFWKDELF